MTNLVLTFMLMALTTISAVELDFVYHNYTKMEKFLRDVNVQFPNLTHLYSIGQSVQNRTLWVLAVSSTPGEHVAGKPEVKYVGNIHGNEPISKEILLHFILLLVTNYGREDRITSLLDRTRIHFLPSMNPDGFEVSQLQCQGIDVRTNARRVDLNRNFPDFFHENPVTREPETAAVMRWMQQLQFVLSAALHGGALVAAYPYGNSHRPRHKQVKEPNVSPDDDVFQHLARTYSFNHKTMSKGVQCKPDPVFQDGIVNGANWYPVTGGMQDYNYFAHGTMEVTIEVGCCKYPPANKIKEHWIENQNALLAYTEQVLKGVRGFVTNQQGVPLAQAKLRISGRNNIFYTTPLGDYWRILLDGNYVLEVNADGYEENRVPFKVNGTATVLNVTMAPAGTAKEKLEIFTFYDEPEVFVDEVANETVPEKPPERKRIALNAEFLSSSSDIQTTSPCWVLLSLPLLHTWGF